MSKLLGSPFKLSLKSEDVDKFLKSACKEETHLLVYNTN